jgi:hypothetical protein
VSGSSVELIEDGRAALRAGDADAARAAFERALAEVATGDALEGLARAAYLQLDYPAAIEQWERAYAAHRRGGDNAAAARVARTLGYTYGSLVGDMAVHSGWMARSQRLLAEAPDDREAGWVTLNRGMFEPDPPTKERLLREAIAIAQRVGALFQTRSKAMLNARIATRGGVVVGPGPREGAPPVHGWCPPTRAGASVAPTPALWCRPGPGSRRRRRTRRSPCPVTTRAPPPTRSAPPAGWPSPAPCS